MADKHSHKFYGPPGTGKTTLLMQLVEEELQKGTQPGEITYCSFTRAASHHARDLAMRRFPEFSREDFDSFATIHSICYKLLGLEPANVFNDRVLQKFAKIFKYHLSDYEDDPLSQAFTEVKVSTTEDYYERFIGWQKNMMIWDFNEAYTRFIQLQPHAPSDFEPHGLKLYMERRQKWQQENKLWDFCDMCIDVLRQELVPSFGSGAFFLDEAQDNSPLLFAVARMWAGNVDRTYIAGDPYQCLYEFSGADPSLMIDMPVDETVTLKQGHRCPRVVHDLARQIAQRFKARYQDDDFFPTGEEGQLKYVFQDTIQFGEADIFSPDYPSTFILFRTNFLLDKFIEALTLRGIPFGARRRKSLLDKKIARVVRAIYSLANMDPVPLLDMAAVIDEVPSKPYMKRGTKKRIRELGAREGERCISWSDLPGLGFTPDFGEAVLGSTDPLSCIQMAPEEKRYFHMVIKQYGYSHLGERRPRLQLGTVHSVKGLEADRVFLSLEMTSLPFENLKINPDAENRIFYVGVTRAKKELGIIKPQRSMAYPL